MLEAITYEGMLKDVAYRSINNDSIGILITRPDLPVGKDILNSLNYYHHASGKNINFYLPGYGAYWHGDYPDGRVVTKIGGVDWSFSDQMFVRFIEALEARSSWTYSGESELLMLEYKDNDLLFKQVMQFHLDNMIRDKVILSTSAFFQGLFRACGSDKALDKISNKFGKDKAVQVTKEAFFNSLPSVAKNLYTQEKYFCVKDCSNLK